MLERGLMLALGHDRIKHTLPRVRERPSRIPTGLFAVEMLAAVSSSPVSVFSFPGPA